MVRTKVAQVGREQEVGEPEAPQGATPRQDAPSGSGLSAHILPTSATMIGVCMTVLSIGHLGPRGDFRIILDKVLAADALMFLASATMSFLSMRSRRFGARYETRAETIFILGLALLAVVAVALAFAID